MTFHAEGDPLKLHPSEALKASQWCVLNRPLAERCAEASPYFIFAFRQVSAPEEWYFRSTANLMVRQGLLRPSQIAEVATNGPRTNHLGPTFVNWHESTGSHPRSYDSICIDELHALVHGPSLFARKFERGCYGLEPLLDMLEFGGMDMF